MEGVSKYNAIVNKALIIYYLGRLMRIDENPSSLPETVSTLFFFFHMKPKNFFKYYLTLVYYKIY